MDWTTPLRSQQMDFMKRLKSGHLLHCDRHGRYSELRTFFQFQLKPSFEPSLATDKVSDKEKGDSFEKQLGKESLKAYLGDFVTDLEEDALTDLTLISNPGVKICVLTCLDTQKPIEWSVAAEEIQKNSVLVFILIDGSQRNSISEYRTILAGFLPTMTIAIQLENAIFTLDNLLYCGGLYSYLESLNYNKREKIEIRDTSSLLNWIPNLEVRELQRGNREEWKQKFIQWLQGIAAESDREDLRLHLYDLLNTQYHREALWKLYVKRERQIHDENLAQEIEIVIQASDRQAETLMLELAGLSQIN
ncbi:MAG: hypothetical protein SW833_01850 [Cyanobacteriota bacterium]|nr:hypothetical protein [Cyanobacteriota bacterium]